MPVQGKIVLGGLGEFWSCYRCRVLGVFWIIRCRTHVLSRSVALMGFHLASAACLDEGLAAIFERDFRILP